MLNVRNASLALACPGVAAAVIFGGLAMPAEAADGPSDALRAVTNAAPDTVANAAPVSTTVAGTTAIELTEAEKNLKVPVNPAAGISFSSEKGTVSIGLPFANDAEDAVVEKPGVVSYDNRNGSHTVPVVRNDGTVQINTVVDNVNAPTRYDYPISVPEGSKLVANEDGSVSAIDGADAVSLIIAAPWAKDADGTTVLTRYQVNERTLTQVVDHTVAGVAYPVTADPKVDTLWWGLAIKLSRDDTRNLNRDFNVLALTGAFCAYAGVYAVPCGLGVAIRLLTWQRPIQDAAEHGRCAQLNIPWGTGVPLWNVTNESC